MGIFNILTRLSGERRITLVPDLSKLFCTVQPLGRRSAIMAFYNRIHEEHWLFDKLEDGRLVILEDDSIWEVHPSDREITTHWLRISTITVKNTEKGSHPYVLSNRTEGEDARADYLRDSVRTNITGEVA